MIDQQSVSNTHSLPASTGVGEVHLGVASLSEALVFYRDILGYGSTEVDGETVALSPDGGPAHFVLHQQEHAVAPGFRTSGLFHAAILLPERRDLALVTQRLVNSGWDIGGASDHGVSEALYLSDVDNNGIEIYVDRPRAAWPVAGSQVRMVTERLDFESLFGELAGSDLEWQGVPSGSTIGHVHLQVGDLEASKRFYVEVLGFDVMQDTYPGALFVAAGGYHHHIGMNTWAGKGIPAPDESATGLKHYSVLLPDVVSLDATLSRLEEAGLRPVEYGNGWLVRDPDGIGVVLRVS